MNTSRQRNARTAPQRIRERLAWTPKRALPRLVAVIYLGTGLAVLAAGTANAGIRLLYLWGVFTLALAIGACLPSPAGGDGA